MTVKFSFLLLRWRENNIFQNLGMFLLEVIRTCRFLRWMSVAATLKIDRSFFFILVANQIDTPSFKITDIFECLALSVTVSNLT